MSDKKTMDPKRLAALRELAESSVSEERGRWRINARPGRVDVSSFVDGRHDETIVSDAGSRVRASMLAFDGHDLAEVLADRDHWEAETDRAFSAWHRVNEEGARLSEELETAKAEAKRWRSRCPVTAEDVLKAGLTWEKFDAWVEAYGFAPARRPKLFDTPKLKIVGRSDIGWVRGDTFYGEPQAWPGNRRAYGLPGQVAGFIMFVSKTDKRPAFDILDEMAAVDS